METKDAATRHSDVYSECLDILIYYIKVHSLAIHVKTVSRKEIGYTRKNCIKKRVTLRFLSFLLFFCASLNLIPAEAFSYPVGNIISNILG